MLLLAGSYELHAHTHAHAHVHAAAAHPGHLNTARAFIRPHRPSLRQSLSYAFWVHAPRVIDAPSLSIALLFALPFVRDVQPSVPPVGIVIDVLGCVQDALSYLYHRAIPLPYGSHALLLNAAQL